MVSRRGGWLMLVAARFLALVKNNDSSDVFSDMLIFFSLEKFEEGKTLKY